MYAHRPELIGMSGAAARTADDDSPDARPKVGKLFKIRGRRRPRGTVHDDGHAGHRRSRCSLEHGTYSRHQIGASLNPPVAASGLTNWATS
jgi:hypothetical protein